MTDIVERLEAAANGQTLIHPNDCREAADTIRRLRKTLNEQAALIELMTRSRPP